MRLFLDMHNQGEEIVKTFEWEYWVQRQIKLLLGFNRLVFFCTQGSAIRLPISDPQDSTK